MDSLLELRCLSLTLMPISMPASLATVAQTVEWLSSRVPAVAGLGV